MNATQRAANRRHRVVRENRQRKREQRRVRLSKRVDLATQRHRQLQEHSLHVPTLAIEIDPRNPNHYYERSIAHSAESNWSAALEDIDKATQLGGKEAVSKFPRFFIQRAVVRMNMGEYQGGLEDCRLIQNLKRPPAEAYRVSGDIFLAMEDNDNANKMFYKAIEIDPGLKELDLSLAKNHHQRREFDKAILYCSRYIDSFPESFEAYQIRADSRYYLVESDKAALEEARKDCDRAIECNPHYLDAYRTLLKVFLKQGDYFDCFDEHSGVLVGGLEDCTKTIQVGMPDSHEIESLLVRVQCRYGLGGNPRMVAKEVHARSQRDNEALYNIFSTIRRKITTSQPTTLDDLFVDGKSDDDKRKILGQAERELESMIGLAAVKEKVLEFKALARLLKENKKAGRESPFNLHALLLGNPGTGKTVVARILGKMYYALGIRSSDKFVEISAADIESAYVGEASTNLRHKIQEAMGGVLFIDEVYQFNEKPELKSAFENELMKYMEDYRDNLTVLAAGYDEKRQVIFNINPGVKSRFNDPDNTIIFPDYPVRELAQIAERMFAKQGRTLTPSAQVKMINYIESRKSIGKMDNARGVRNLVDTMILQAAKKNRFEEIDADDVPDVKKETPIDEILVELSEKFIGLQSVKDRIIKIARRIEHDERKGIVSGQKYNMQFIGNPGTGKTTIARYMSRVFNSVGLIEGKSRDRNRRIVS